MNDCTEFLCTESWVGGKQVPSSSDERHSVYSPITRKNIGDIPAGSDDDVSLAVASSRAAFSNSIWSELPSFRKKVLSKFADLIEENSSQLDQLDAVEMGKPVSVGFANASSASGLTRYFSEAVDKLSGDFFSSDKSTFVGNRLVPYGVVAAIAPWNFPSYNAILKSVPALAAGSCVVLKPSELSSRSAIKLAELATEAGFPDGVFNVVLGLGETVGKNLALNMGVDFLTFTGSTDVGKLMLKYSSESNMKPVIAECGGKSPQIVFDDGVDLDGAAAVIAHLILVNQGQLCSAGSRLLVQESIEAELIAKVAEQMQAIVPGDPRDPNTTFGPLVSERQMTRVLAYIESAQDEGADYSID